MTGASETGNCLHRTLTTHTLAEMCKLLVEMLSIMGKQTLDMYIPTYKLRLWIPLKPPTSPLLIQRAMDHGTISAARWARSTHQ